MALTTAWHDLVHDMRDDVHDVAVISRVSAARQAFLALWITFMALPLLWGIDMFAGFLHIARGWSSYVATWVNDAIPGGTSAAVHTMGVITIALAVVVFAAPRIGGDLMAAWFALMSISMFSVGGMQERAFGMLALALCCLAMARMSTAYHHQEGRHTL